MAVTAPRATNKPVQKPAEKQPIEERVIPPISKESISFFTRDEESSSLQNRSEVMSLKEFLSLGLSMSKNILTLRNERKTPYVMFTDKDDSSSELTMFFSQGALASLMAHYDLKPEIEEDENGIDKITNGYLLKGKTIVDGRSALVEISKIINDEGEYLILSKIGGSGNISADDLD